MPLGSKFKLFSDGNTVGYTIPIGADGNNQKIGINRSSTALLKTRPADGTAYAAKDLISATSAQNWTFPNVVAAVGGSGRITKVRVQGDQKGEVWRPRIHFYTVAPTAIADNSPMLMKWADRLNYIGYVDLPALQTEDGTNSDTAFSQVVTSGLSFICAANDTAIIAQLETLDAFTPITGAKYIISLDTEND